MLTLSLFFKFFKVFWFYKTVQHSICVKQRKEITNIFNIYMGIHIVCVFIQIYMCKIHIPDLKSL